MKLSKFKAALSIGLILTFVSLIYVSEEPYFWVDWTSTYPIGGALTYGFPFGWIALGGPSVFFSPFDVVAFLFDITFWAIISYLILGLVSAYRLHHHLQSKFQRS
ncbi:MAG: hypothetical protein OEZ21_11490 [Candidatus Bathyarchaeota archaeon]|nr:hypothetical protein [Candidatus Bathyarchaeota archaeon]